MSALVKLFSGIAASVLDFFTMQMIGVFNLNISNADGGILQTIDTYFPLFKTTQYVMIFIGMTIALLMLIMNMYRSMLDKLVSEEVESPPFLIVRYLGVNALILSAFTFCKFAIYLASYWYAAMWQTTIAPINTITATTNQFTQLSTNLQTNVVNSITLPLGGLFLVLIIMLAIGWNFLKLIMEVAERFVLIAILSYTSPIAASALSSRTTQKIFSGWCRVYMSQFLLLTLNVWIIRAFNSAMALYLTSSPANTGAITVGTDLGQVSTVVGGTSLETGNVTGSAIIFLITILALLIAAQRLDSYLQSTGFSTAQTGGQMLGEMLLATKTIGGTLSGIGRGAGAVSASSAMGRAQMIPVAAGSAGSAAAKSGFVADAASGVIKTSSGDQAITAAAINKETGAFSGQTETLGGGGKGSTFVASTPLESVKDGAMGHRKITPEGNHVLLTASGPAAPAILSAIGTKANAGMPGVSDGTMGGFYNNEYKKAMAAGDLNPRQTAKENTNAFAAGNGGLNAYQAHQADAQKIFGEGSGINGAEITPNEKLAGVYNVTGTADDGQLVAGTLVDKGIVGEKSASEYPDAESYTDDASNHYAFLPSANEPDFNGMNGIDAATEAEDAANNYAYHPTANEPDFSGMNGIDAAADAEYGEGPDDIDDNQQAIYGVQNSSAAVGAFNSTFGGQIQDHAGNEYGTLASEYGQVDDVKDMHDGILQARMTAPDNSHSFLTFSNVNGYNEPPRDNIGKMTSAASGQSYYVTATPERAARIMDGKVVKEATPLPRAKRKSFSESRNGLRGSVMPPPRNATQQPGKVGAFVRGWLRLGGRKSR